MQRSTRSKSEFAGNGAYVYNWSSGSQFALANDLCAGNHAVSIHDAKVVH